MEIAVICGVCALVLLIGLMKKRAEFVLNFMVRAVVGMIGVYFLNQFLVQQEIGVAVGMNPINALTIGILGVGGFAMLYGVMYYQIL